MHSDMLTGSIGDLQTIAFPLPEGQPHYSLVQPARSATRGVAGGRPRIENDEQKRRSHELECYHVL